MPKPNEADINNVIESAMSRLDGKALVVNAEPDPALARKSLGRRDYDLALAQRLEQLRTAMGEDTPEALPIPPVAAPAIVNAPRRTFQPGTLLATAIFSALAGAGIMWLAIGGNPPAPEPHTRSISPAPVAPIAQVAPIPATEATPPTPPAPVRNDDDQVRDLLEAWRLAWSNRDIENYLSHYAPDFTPADGQKRADWAAARRKNISSRPDINVQVRDPRIERIDENQIRLEFLQDYTAGAYREKDQAKTLLLVRQDDRWQIAGEWQGKQPARR
ncbi:MAG: hypothetical protein Q8S26_18810 [Azonexus sp.]|nr:hypothetical protein [Azonexus sp.]